MIVAYYMPHNEGCELGILDEPDQDTELDLVDLYEVDGVIRTFATRSEAEAWLVKKQGPRTPESDDYHMHRRGLPDDT